MGKYTYQFNLEGKRMTKLPIKRNINPLNTKAFYKKNLIFFHKDTSSKRIYDLAVTENEGAYNTFFLAQNEHLRAKQSF